MEHRKRPRAPPLNRTRAKAMRQDPVALEKFFWSHLRNRQLGGFKFRRQLPIGPYIADFVCAKQKIPNAAVYDILYTEGEAYESSRILK